MRTSPKTRGKISMRFNHLLLSAVLFVVTVLFIQAEEAGVSGTPYRAGFPISVSAGMEANNNHQNGIALGFVVQADYRVFPFLAAGARGGFSTNITFSNTLEAEGFVRFILPLRSLQVFTQGGAGLSWIFIYEGNTAIPLFGGALGVRIPLGAFYIEPAARFGFPFLWGAGLSAGVRFDK